MHLQDLTTPIPFGQMLSDPELTRDIQACLKTEQTGVFGVETNHLLWRFCFDQRLDNYHTQVFDPELAEALLNQ